MPDTDLFEANNAGKDATESPVNASIEGIAVFARALRKGQVKTRLAASQGNDVALQVHRQLLCNTLQQVQASGRDCALFASQACPELTAISQQYGARLNLQEGDGLGARMIAALAWMHRHYSKVLLVGSDCAPLHATYLLQAFEALDTADVVIGPAEDGGFWLLGSANPLLWNNPDWFVGVPFGGAEALAHTLARLQQSDAVVTMVSKLWDLDNEADYRRACREGFLSENER